jgi:hypothetical protein
MGQFGNYLHPYSVAGNTEKKVKTFKKSCAHDENSLQTLDAGIDFVTQPQRVLILVVAAARTHAIGI